MQKGYIKQTPDVEKLQQIINALNEAGMPSDSVMIAEDFGVVLAELEAALIC